MKNWSALFKHHWRLFLMSAVLITTIISLSSLLYLFTNNTPYLDYSLNAQPDKWAVYTKQGENLTMLKPYQQEFQTIHLEYPGQTFYMSRVLSEEYKAPILVFNQNHYHVTVFLDGRPIYSDLPNLNYQIGSLQYPALSEDTVYRTEPVYLSLPSDYAGKTLTLGLQIMPLSAFSTEIITPPIFLYADIESILNESVSLSSRYAFPAGALAALGIALVILYLFQLRRAQAKITVLTLAGMAFLWMGYFIIIINRNTLSQELSSLLSWTFYTLSFAPLFAILELHMKKYNHIYRPFVFIYFVFVVVVGIWWAVVGQPERWLLNLFMPLSSLAFGVALVLSVLEWRQKNKFFRQLAIWLGFGVLIALLCYLISLPTNASFADIINMQIKHMFVFHNLTFLKNILALFLLTALYGISIVQFVRDSVQKDLQIQSLELQSKYAEQSALQMRSGINDVRQIKHEMAHHIETLKLLFQKQDFERLGQYIDSLDEHNKTIEPLYYCENFLINAIVSVRFKQARDQGITVQYWLYAPNRLNISDASLSTFLMNALDNAIEATGKIPDSKNRWIKLKITYNQTSLFISCENSIAQPIQLDEDGLILTTKSKTSQHGFGLSNMKRIAEKYHSILIIEHTNDTFCVKTNLQIPSSNSQ